MNCLSRASHILGHLFASTSVSKTEELAREKKKVMKLAEEVFSQYSHLTPTQRESALEKVRNLVNRTENTPSQQLYVLKLLKEQFEREASCFLLKNFISYISTVRLSPVLLMPTD